jgi:hypothetical protein
VTVTGFDITLDVEGDGGAGPIRLPALKGAGKLVPGGTTTLVLESPIESGDRTGALDVDVTAAGLLDAQGRLTPGGATLRATATLRNVDVPFAEQVEVLDRLALEAQSDDLTEAIALGIAGETTVEGGVGCRLTGSVTALRPMTADGRVTLRLARMTADLEGHDVPTALLQPFVAMELAGGEVTLTDLLGPKLNVAAKVSEGAEKEVAVTLTAPRLSSELSARVDQRGAVRNGRGSIVATERRAAAGRPAGDGRGGAGRGTRHARPEAERPDRRRRRAGGRGCPIGRRGHARQHRLRAAREGLRAGHRRPRAATSAGSGRGEDHVDHG